jgi:protein SCO1/2
MSLSYRHTISRIAIGLVISFVFVLTSCGTAQPATKQASPDLPVQASSGLQGTDLGASSAPDFHLFDQHHQMTSLSQFHGLPVILTFFYTHCPDYCPLIASKIHSALVPLGSNSQHVAIVAISADPSGDTPANVATFAQEHQLQGYAHWHYLLGTRPALTPVWTAYNVTGVPENQKQMGMSAMQHSAVVYVIDGTGHERVLLDSDFAPTQLTQDLQLLLKNATAEKQ